MISSVLGLVALAVAAASAAQAPHLVPRPEVPAFSATVHPGGQAVAATLNAADLGPFLDALIGQQIAHADVAGAVVSIVKDGRPLFSRGYGYADVAAKRPVDPATTGFRVGSISKIFTGTAVMQLVEQGKLDLDKDVAAYLDFTIARRFPQPITLRRLLTHTAGFEERGKNFLIAPETPTPTLRDYLIKNPAVQGNAPGSRISYSNYGVTLAGYIAQRISGRPWADLIKDGIFQPLGMTNSSALQPLLPPVLGDLSKEYDRASTPAQPFQIVPDAPAGAVTTTGDDMAKFMLAHLADGDTAMLKAATLAEMHRKQWAVTPAGDGIAINFIETDGHGHRVLSHGGDLSRFHSELWLMPDRSFGVFVAYNSTGAGTANLRGDLWEALLDRYFPVTGPMPPAMVTAKADAAAVAGSYLSTRRSKSSALAPIFIVGQASVVADQDGSISVPGLLTSAAGTSLRFREIGPLVYQQEGGTRRMVFARDADGTVRRLGVNGYFEGERATTGESLLLNGIVYGGAFAVLLLALVQWPIGWAVRRRYARPLAAMLDTAARRDRLWLRFAAAFALVFLTGWLGFFVAGATNLSLFADSSDGFLRVFQLFGLITLAGAVLAVVVAWRAWHRASGTRLYRVGVTLITLSVIAVASFVLRLHVLSPSLHY